MTVSNPGVGVNPSVDVVLAEVTQQIRASCAPVTIDQDAIDDWVYTYKPPFQRRLNVALWDSEKANVLNAATQHGIIAKALANLSGLTQVDTAMLRTASALVVEYCHKRFAQGFWCS